MKTHIEAKIYKLNNYVADSPAAPDNLQASQSIVTVQIDWSPPLNDDGNIRYQVTVDNATKVMYSDDTMAFVTLNSSGQYHVNITAVNCAGSSPALSGIINIIDTGSYTVIILFTKSLYAYISMWVLENYTTE